MSLTEKPKHLRQHQTFSLCLLSVTTRIKERLRATLGSHFCFQNRMRGGVGGGVTGDEIILSGKIFPLWRVGELEMKETQSGGGV